jgi:hypothetical protein
VSGCTVSDLECLSSLLPEYEDLPGVLEKIVRNTKRTEPAAAGGFALSSSLPSPISTLRAQKIISKEDGEPFVIRRVLGGNRHNARSRTSVSEAPTPETSMVVLSAKSEEGCLHTAVARIRLLK